MNTYENNAVMERAKEKRYFCQVDHNKPHTIVWSLVAKASFFETAPYFIQQVPLLYVVYAKWVHPDVAAHVLPQFSPRT